MHEAANKQKLRSEVSEFKPPKAKASVLVSEVIVIEGPACCMASLMRLLAGSNKSV